MRAALERKVSEAHEEKKQTDCESRLKHCCLLAVCCALCRQLSAQQMRHEVRTRHLPSDQVLHCEPFPPNYFIFP